jgi:DNA replication protein DnaC
MKIKNFETLQSEYLDTLPKGKFTAGWGTGFKNHAKAYLKDVMKKFKPYISEDKMSKMMDSIKSKKTFFESDYSGLVDSITTARKKGLYYITINMKIEQIVYEGKQTFRHEFTESYVISTNGKKKVDQAVENYINFVFPDTDKNGRRYRGIRSIGSDNNAFEYLLNYSHQVSSVKKLKKEKVPIKDILMFNAFTHCTYHNIKSNESVNQNAKECVFDAIEKRLGISREKQLSLYNEYYADAWGDKITFKDGVSPAMIHHLCEKRDISEYAFDADNNIIYRNVSKSRNNNVLIYYCIDSHMYLITEKQEVQHIVKVFSAKNGEKKFIASIVDDKEAQKAKEFSRDITGDVKIEDLEMHKDCVIMYPVTNLLDMFVQLFVKYNHIFDVQASENKIKAIYLNSGIFQGKNVTLMVDASHDAEGNNWETMKQMTDKVNILFQNQGFGALASTILKQVTEQKRVPFTKEVKAQVLNKSTNKCATCKEKLSTAYQIDHIKPLAGGGSNEIDNLQALCMKCHKDKCEKDTQNDDYFKVSEYNSSFNKVTSAIFQSALMKPYAFIEKIAQPRKDNGKTYFIDINKTRKNIMYYSKYDWCLFTVMDEPKPFDGTLKTGFYYVNTRQYFPLRGSGWYSQPLIEYCLEHKLIHKYEIQYQLIPSVTIPANYFNKFIDFVYSTYEVKQAKRIVNSLIGSFNIMSSKFSKVRFTTDDTQKAVTCLTHCLAPTELYNQDGKKLNMMTNTRVVEYSEHSSPLYNQILNMESVELHKLYTIVKQNEGRPLEMNTDCVACQLPEKIDLSKFEWAEGVPKYKYEESDKTLKTESMKGFTRTETYHYHREPYTTIEERDEFNDIAEEIVTMDEGINIDGCAGTGKTYLIKTIMKQLDEKDKKYITLAPTNKASRLVDGQTIHKFLLSYRRVMNKKLQGIDYIIIDEISMMKELFYKEMLQIKANNDHIKFILVGDFRQIKPVLDRSDFDYKNSYALYDLVDGNRIELTKCRRSDDTMFKMSFKLDKLDKSEFKSCINMLNVCYTNKTRVKVNKECNEAHIKKAKEANIKIPANKNDPNSQDMVLFKNVPVISHRNDAEFEIANNDTFTVKKIDKVKQVITIVEGNTTIEMPVEAFSRIFYLAYCITAHKSQGTTFDKPYTIHEWEIMSEELKYVSFTRGTKLDNISFV